MSRAYEECLSVRRHPDHPFVFDENIDSLDVLLRAKADLATSGVLARATTIARPLGARATR